jgi:chromosomal replication initiator protein
MLDWDNAVESIKAKVGAECFEVWFRPIKFLTLEDGVLYLEVPNRFYLKWITERYLDKVTEALFEQTGCNLEVVFRIAERDNTYQHFSLTKDFSFEEEGEYTFGNFVVGESNRLPYQTALQISNFTSPSYYNPCYIYSHWHGIGKTHLLKAVKNYIDRLKPDKSACYISANDFAKTVYYFDQNDKTDDLRHYFCNADVILFDDIQTLPNRPRLQDEFIFMINTLYNIKKQIVVTSDRLPRDMNNVDSNIRSRLSGGIIAEIGVPDFELKKKILSAKCLSENITLSDEIMNLICSINEYDIRKLSNYIRRLATVASVEKKTITVDSVKRIFETELLDPIRQVENIQGAVCRYFKLSPQQLLSPKKSQSISLARQIAMYLARTHTGLSFAKIGELFGGRDHSTVLKARSAIKTKMLHDRDVENTINEINKLLRK